MTDKRPDEVIAFVKETYGEIPREDLKEFLKLLGEAAVPDLQRLEAELSAGRWTEAADSAHRLGGAGDSPCLGTEWSVTGSVKRDANCQASGQATPARNSR
jgi:hypothetical protein